VTVERVKAAVFAGFHQNGIVSSHFHEAVWKRRLRSAYSRGATTGVAIGLSVASWAHAGDSHSGARSADIAAAQALFERGRQLMAQRHVEEACPLFEESLRLDAGIGTQFNLAACHEAAGRFASAYTLFLEVAGAARVLDQRERAEVAAARARGVEPKLSRLIIEVEPKQRAALTLERDGSLVGSPQLGLAVPVDPGVHEVRAGGPGLLPWARQIEVGARPVVYTVRVPVLPLAARDPAPCDPGSGDDCATPDGAALGSEAHEHALRHTIGYAALGIGVAGLAFGAGFAIHAYSKNQSAEEAGCNDRGCPDQASLTLRRQAVAAGNWATVGAGICLASVAAAGILLWILPEPPPSPKPMAKVVPRLTADVAGIDIFGQF